MKTRNVLIIILIIALLAVYYIIGTGFLKGRNQKTTLTAQIAEANAALAIIPQPPADLDEQIAKAQDDLEVAKDSISIDTNITRIINGILRLGDETGVKAIPLSTQSWVLENISGQNYAVFRIDMAASGNYTQLVSFLNRLENGEPKTLTLERLTVEKVSGAFLLGNPTEGLINAEIKIAVYAPATTSEL